MIRIAYVIAIALCAILAACGGGGGGGNGVTPAGPTGPTPTPAPPTTPILLMENGYQVLKLQLNGTGATYAQTLTMQQTGYTGAFTASSTDCSGVVSYSVASTAISVTGQQAGKCTIIIANSYAQTLSLPVSVTISAVGIQ
jgi:hypothetical protein